MRTGSVDIEGNCFVFAVVGDLHVAALGIPLSFLKKYSRFPIVVLQARSSITADHDRVLSVALPDQLDDRQASAFLKTSLLDHVRGEGARFCYLDSDVIAVSEQVDMIFDEAFHAIRFAEDHVDLDTFSRWAVRCGCTSPQCTHLREAIDRSFGLSLPPLATQVWNGGVFLFDSNAAEVMRLWNDMVTSSFSDPYWYARDQGTLIAALWRAGLADHAPLPRKFNFIVDRFRGLTEAERTVAPPGDFHVPDDFFLRGVRDGRTPPCLVHFINGGIGRVGWRPWEETQSLLEGATASLTPPAAAWPAESPLTLRQRSGATRRRKSRHIDR